MKFLLIQNGSTENRGCEAILLSTYNILKLAHPDAKIISCSARDFRLTKIVKLKDLTHISSQKLLSINTIKWQFLKRILLYKNRYKNYLSTSDYVLALGGDNYTMDYGDPINLFESNEEILRKNKLIIWGASIGPFEPGSSTELYAIKQLQQVHKIVVRESFTQLYLKNIGVTFFSKDFTF